MNKIVRVLPKNMFNRYIIKHAKELTEQDVIYLMSIGKVDFNCLNLLIASDNENIKNSSDILSGAIDIDPSFYSDFNPDAFTEEIVDKLAKSSAVIGYNDVYKYPFFLKNEILREKILDKNCSNEVVSLLDKDMIDERVVSILVKRHYIPTMEDLSKSELISSNADLLKNAISKHPELLLREDLIGNLNTKQYDNLMESSIEVNPKSVVYYRNAENIIRMSYFACQHGYNPTREDLISNPLLRLSDDVMAKAISNDPSSVVLLTRNNIRLSNSEVIRSALEKITVSEKDIIDNPDLVYFEPIISSNKNLEKYGLNHSDLYKKKEYLKNTINKDGELTIENAPFLDITYSGKTDVSKVNELYGLLKMTVDEENINEQQKYFDRLDTVIDQIVLGMYDRQKNSLKLSSPEKMQEFLLKSFESLMLSNNNDVSSVANELRSYVNNYIPLEQTISNLEKFFEIYKEQNNIGIEHINSFCTDYLNAQLNLFVSTNKDKIKEEVISSLDLSVKKKKTILNGKKIVKASALIRNKEFDKLGISEEELDNLLNDINNKILNNKDIKKKNLESLDVTLRNAALLFKKYGSIDLDMLERYSTFKDEEVFNYIKSNYGKALNILTKDVILSGGELSIDDNDKAKVDGFNYNNYLIADNNRIMDNITNILLSVDEEKVNKMLDNRKYIDKIKEILPFVNVVPGLDSETFINIMASYERITNKLGSDADLISELNDFINCGNAYSSANAVKISALGEEFALLVGEQDALRYLEPYKETFNRVSGSIPPVSLNVNGYSYESGMYTDPARLALDAIMKKQDPNAHSCLGIGSYASDEVLYQETGDVVIVRNSNNEPISRIILFRRGNVVQMIANSSDKLDMEACKQIANQMIAQSISSQDNIDYIFLNSSANMHQYEEDKTVEDAVLGGKLFPHTDAKDYAYLIASKDPNANKTNVNLDWFAPMKAAYRKARKKINTNPTSNEVSRLRALSVELENDISLKEEKARNFEPILMNEFERVIAGEDWYIAIRSDGSFEEVVLPSLDNRTMEEVNMVKEELGLSREGIIL